MVAAVAFSGVLTSTSADAQTSYRLAPGESTTIEVENGSTAPADVTDVVTFTVVTESPADDTKDTYTMTAARLAAYGDRTVSWQDVGADAASNKTLTITPVQANPGHTVTVIVNAADNTENVYRLSADSTAKGSFTDNPGRSFIICGDRATGTDITPDATATPPVGPPACDYDNTTGDTSTYEGISGQVTLRVTVAADSSKGTIYITAGTNVNTERAIAVSPAQVATGMTLSPPALGISSNAGGDGSTITINVTDNRGQAVDGQLVQLSTTRGQFVNCGTPPVTLPVCNVVTANGGTAEVTLRGDNRAGSATVTATAGTLTRSAAVTFFGQAASLTAAAAGGVATVDQGAMGYVFLTVNDKDGNAVTGATPGSSVTTEIENPTVVSLDGSVEYEGNPATPADNVPACTAGTNVAGQCAVQISAGPTASRGIHTVAASMEVRTAAGPKVLSDKIDIRVVGAPHSIETDAPESVEPRTTVKVTVSVFDDEGELVGGGNVKVTKLEGRGAVLGTDDDDNAALRGGMASFRYYATSTDTAAVFEITAGAGPAAVTEIIEIVVAAAAVEAEPEPDPGPPATWNNELVSGQNLVVWNGEDGADPSAGAAEGVTAIWSYNTGSGSWDGYFPDAADVPGGNTLTSLSNGQAYVVIVE